MKLSLSPSRPLVPCQGTFHSRRPTPQGIGRRWLSQPWAMLFRPVGPVNRAPNGGREPSPGLSNAMPRDPTPTNDMRPNGAREIAAWGEEEGK